jgi:hypothetical protein
MPPAAADGDGVHAAGIELGDFDVATKDVRQVVIVAGDA